MYLLIWIICFLALLSPVTARQERESPFPTIAPTKPPKNKDESDVDDDYEHEDIETERPTPTPTSHPTKSPSFEPSQQPTFSAEPSTVPSMSPSVVPSAQPSFVPSSMPSLVPSDLPSPAPSSVPTTTIQPSFYPSSLPSISPTGVLSTPLPWINLAFRPPTDETTEKTKALKPIDIELLRKAVDSFLVQFITTTISRKSFDSLNANVLMQSDSEFLITGEVLFVARVPPSEEFLKEKLITYFTFWGIRDLKSHLDSAGLSVANAKIDITVAGERVLDGGNNDNADVPSDTSKDEGSSSFEKSIVIGTIIAVVALVGAMIFAAYKWRGYSASSSTPSNGSRHATLGSPGRQEQPLVSSSKSAPAKESPVEEFVIDDLQSQSGMSGLHSMADDSLFYDAVKDRGPSSTVQYDASRLDQVISSAKQNSDTDDGF